MCYMFNEYMELVFLSVVKDLIVFVICSVVQR